MSEPTAKRVTHTFNIDYDWCFRLDTSVNGRALDASSLKLPQFFWQEQPLGQPMHLTPCFFCLWIYSTAKPTIKATTKITRNLFASQVSLPDDAFLELIERGFSAHEIVQALKSDINLVALKADILISQGHPLCPQEHRNDFLRYDKWWNSACT